MTDDVLIRRSPEETATAENSPAAEWGARPAAAALKGMGANVTIQKNWQELIRPNKLQVTPGGDPKREAIVIAEPLERGFGVTLGNALRRILLSSLQGAAVQSVHIDGVLHEFSSIPGVREDVTDIVLNIKDIAIKMQGDGPKRMVVKKQGPGAVTAGDIQTVGDTVVLNPDLVLCTLDEGAEIRMEFTVNTGKGYVPTSAIGRRTRRLASSRWTAFIRRSVRSLTRSRIPAKGRSSITTS
jgi:DNA-directed RNA polymerase, alpha subunit/40 kD subunit